jgi:transposase
VLALLHGPYRVGCRLVMILARWRRPRLVAKGDPDHDQVVADLRQAISQLPAGAVVLAEDEAHLNLLPWVRSTWILKGSRQRVMTPGTNRRRSIFGAVDLASGRFLYQVARKAVSATFIAFCEQLLAAYPAAPKVVVVCDNVIIHRSKLVCAWLADHPRILVLHGARYSPHDNPVERIWGALKAWLANSPDPDHGRADPPSPRLLPAALTSPTDGHCRAPQLTLAPRQLRTEPPAGCLGGKSDPLSPKAPFFDVTAYRVVQEALTNVGKHADNATRVRLSFGPAALHILVEDEGNGRAAPDAARSLPDRRHAGHGIVGMRERVAPSAAAWMPARGRPEGSGSAPYCRCQRTVGHDRARPARRRPAAAAGGVQGRHRLGTGSGGGRRGGHRAAGRRAGPADPRRRRAHGRPHAGHGRPDRHPADHRR